MRLGPLSITHFEKLKAILDQQGAKYQVTYDQSQLDERHQQMRDQPVTGYPTYTGMGDFIYLEIELKDALLIRGETEKMGLNLGDRLIQPEPEVEEFLCPKCGRVSTKKETCPKHGLVMVSFSEYAGLQRFQERKISWIVLILFVGAIAGMILGKILFS